MLPLSLGNELISGTSMSRVVDLLSDQLNGLICSLLALSCLFLLLAIPQTNVSTNKIGVSNGPVTSIHNNHQYLFNVCNEAVTISCIGLLNR